MRPPEQLDLGPVLALEELAADKVLAWADKLDDPPSTS